MVEVSKKKEDVMQRHPISKARIDRIIEVSTKITELQKTIDSLHRELQELVGGDQIAHAALSDTSVEHKREVDRLGESRIDQRILAVLADRPNKPYRALEIKKLVEPAAEATVRTTLARLARQKKIRRRGRGVYQARREQVSGGTSEAS
jgi:hypothetical protein